MSRSIEGGRYQPPFYLGWVPKEPAVGEYLQQPHVVDASGRIVSFGKPKGQDSLFYDPKKAETAAELLNSGRSPEDINIRDPK